MSAGGTFLSQGVSPPRCRTWSLLAFAAPQLGYRSVASAILCLSSRRESRAYRSDFSCVPDWRQFHYVLQIVAQYDPYDEDRGEYQEFLSSFEESLIEALDFNVQLSVNTALSRALGPVISHLKGFTRQQGWLPPLTAFVDPIPASASQTEGKAKGEAKA
ncbi:hypothetical protein NDU88_001855 [Pleurodeles waltl]|uniref:Uncharacterized protein n=1 Tax=Pleurodeles waltl TaxID=8319 RepID=A0AAV7KTY5_PLEWA|nr:hypothetical protein NDU88_001855 [Pleurodeles waltl]